MQARSQDFSWPPALNPERSRRENVMGCGVILPQEILKKMVRQHFMRFEDSWLGNKAGKSEGH